MQFFAVQWKKTTGKGDDISYLNAIYDISNYHTLNKGQFWNPEEKLNKIGMFL